MKKEWTKYSLVDTNVWIYAIDYSDEFKQEIANDLLESALEGELKLATTTQILAEVANVCIRLSRKNLKEPSNDAKIMVSALTDIKGLPKLTVEPEIVFSAIDIKKKSDVEFYDALIAATMLENGITTIYTEDKAFDKIEGITAINPFGRHAKTI